MEEFELQSICSEVEVLWDNWSTLQLDRVLAPNNE